jgi:hypothetical protein
MEDVELSPVKDRENTSSRNKLVLLRWSVKYVICMFYAYTPFYYSSTKPSNCPKPPQRDIDFPVVNHSGGFTVLRLSMRKSDCQEGSDCPEMARWDLGSL